MAGQRGPHTQACGFLIADLANQHHVWILAQEATNCVGEGDTRLLVNLHLLDQRHGVFHRVLNGKNVLFHGIDGAHNRVQCCGLSRTGGTGNQYHAVWGVSHICNKLDLLVHEAEILQRQELVAT